MTGTDTPSPILVLTPARHVVTVRSMRFDRESRSGRAVRTADNHPLGDGSRHSDAPVRSELVVGPGPAPRIGPAPPHPAKRGSDADVRCRATRTASPPDHRRVGSTGPDVAAGGRHLAPHEFPDPAIDVADPNALQVHNTIFHSVARSAFDTATIDDCGHLAAAESEGVVGHDSTPFLLDYVQRATQGRSLDVNVAAYRNNVALAGQIAAALWGNSAATYRYKHVIVVEEDIDPTDIAVAVKNGVVTLTGFVRSYTHKFAAERAAKRVAGVVGVANDLEVRLPQTDERPDPEIAREVVANLKIWLPNSWEHIKAIVKNGWVTLEGEVEWNYQRDYAERAVRWIKGVKGVSNLIRLQPRLAPEPSRTSKASA